MTRPERLRHAASIYEAYDSKKEIEFHYSGGKWGAWRIAIESESSDSPENQPERWRIAPKPVTRPWNCPEDVPMPICWIRRKSIPTSYCLITAVDSQGVWSGQYSAFFSELSEREHSTDGVTWKPCTVEETK